MPPRSQSHPPALLAFLTLFNRGEFWEGHEVLEGPWRDGRSDFYKGLILYASAFVHVHRRNPRGVVAQLRKAERHLASYRPAYLGVDVEAILAHAARCIARINEGSRDWDSLLPPPLELDPARVRGDEVERGEE